MIFALGRELDGDRMIPFSGPSLEKVLEGGSKLLGLIDRGVELTVHVPDGR